MILTESKRRQKAHGSKRILKSEIYRNSMKSYVLTSGTIDNLQGSLDSVVPMRENNNAQQINTKSTQNQQERLENDMQHYYFFISTRLFRLFVEVWENNSILNVVYAFILLDFKLHHFFIKFRYNWILNYCLSGRELLWLQYIQEIQKSIANSMCFCILIHVTSSSVSDHHNHLIYHCSYSLMDATLWSLGLNTY